MNNWIKVSDRLPDDDMNVLSYHPDWGTGISRFKPGLGFDSSQILIPYLAPSYWMPLPDDPED